VAQGTEGSLSTGTEGSLSTDGAVELLGIDAVEFHVGNAKQAARAWSGLGFRPSAYRPQEMES